MPFKIKKGETALGGWLGQVRLAIIALFVKSGSWLGKMRGKHAPKG